MVMSQSTKNKLQVVGLFMVCILIMCAESF